MVTPLLTVVMPHYNDAAHLEGAVNSVLTQSFSDFELLILDDASTKEAADSVRAIAKRDRRVRPIFYHKNIGSIPRFQQGAFLARGKYLHDMGADDLRYPDFFQESIHVLEEDPSLAACFSQFHWGKEENKELERCGLDAAITTVQRFEPSSVAPLFLAQKLKISAVSALYRADLARRYGSYDPQLTYFADWYLMHQLAFHHPIAVIPKPLCFFRVHERNYSNVARHNKKIKCATYKRMLDKLGKERALRAQFRTSGLLAPLFEDLFWKMLVNPRYLTYWPYINKRYPIKERIMRSIQKKMKKKSPC